MNSAPLRTYYFSDTYGGQEEWNPLALQDPDVLISTDFGARPNEKIHREFDIFGQEEVVAHILRLVLAKHDELLERADLQGEKRDNARNATTGIFINSAPRTHRTNAEPFYVATARSGKVRIVSTPLTALSGIKSDIETLHLLPNPPPDGTNGLYGGREQFRSQYTPILLDPDHGLTLENADTADIPDPRKDWHISYVDRFGNVITRIKDADKQWSEIQKISRKSIRLLLGENKEAQPTQPLELTTSLAEATPGIASIYKNSGGIDIVVKWMPNQKANARLSSSAWQELGKPKIGTSIKIGSNDM